MNPDMHPPSEDQNKGVLIWDAPTRIFHWLLAASFFITLVTGDSDRLRDIHVAFGYLILGLIGFRIVWGFSGSRYARFKSFLFGWRAVLDYLRDLLGRRKLRHVGHNPPGGWAIFGMLGLGLIVCISGVLVLGTEEGHGLLSRFATHQTGEIAKDIHEGLAWLMLALVLAHIAGVLGESWLHRENLVKAMLTGRKAGSTQDGIASSYRFVGFTLLVCAAAGIAWYLAGRVVEAPGEPYVPFVGKQLPDNKLWREECGSCHIAFHASLLPARSWTALLDRQNEHFGERLGLDAPTIAGILDFLEKNAAETGITEPAFKINRSIPENQTPLRITETGYWMEKHRSIQDAVWKNTKIRSTSNCGACHRDADKGTFEDAAMQLPPLEQ